MRKLFQTGILSILCTSCLLDEAELSVAESELSDPRRLPAVDGPPTPAGYGHYCSVTDPANGGWAFAWRTSNTSDPCRELAAGVGSTAVVQRAGLFAVNGNNNVMVRCDGGTLFYGRAFGEPALSWIFGQAPRSGKNCIFTVAPTKLPAFGLPFLSVITGTGVFDYNYTSTGWDVSEFGVSGGSGKACSVDRKGVEQARLDASGKCVKVSAPGHDAFEPAYDWSFASGSPIYAVADGVIRRSYARNTDAICNGSDQLELFLETQVGTGAYAEHFVAAYHHMNPTLDFTQPGVLQNFLAWGGKPMAPDGWHVKKGDVIAYNGTSGCSGGPHLDLMVFRLTNLTDARSYAFQALDNLSLGVNGWQGIIDPFGWAAPSGVDPLAYKLIGAGPTPEQPSHIQDPGAFSINLWESKTVFDFLTHNGGASY